MINNLIINNELIEHIQIASGYQHQTGEVHVETVDVVGNSRSIFKRVEKKGWEGTIPILYLNRMYGINKSYEEIIDEVVEFVKIGTGEELEIGQTNSDYHRRGYFTGVIESEVGRKNPRVLRLDLSVKYVEPYKYSNKVSSGVIRNNTVRVTNTGDEVEPILRFTASESARYLSLINTRNGDELKIGENSIGDTKQEEVNVFRMSGLNGIEDVSSRGNHFIYEGGLIKPQFDNLGGDVEGRHTLSSALSDFNQFIMFRTQDMEPGQISTSYIYLKNSSGQNVATLEMIVDPNARDPRVRDKARVVFKVRNKAGTGMIQLLDYVGDDFRRVYSDSDLTVRIIRTGNTYSLKTWKFSRAAGEITGRHSPVWKDDRGVLYSDDLITNYEIGFKRVRGVPTSELGIGNLEINELVNGDSPYYDIVKEGDLVEIDNYKKLVTVNGEPINNLKDIFSEYIKLDRGINNISVFPRGVYEGTIEYRERKL